MKTMKMQANVLLYKKEVNRYESQKHRHTNFLKRALIQHPNKKFERKNLGCVDEEKTIKNKHHY